MPTDVVLALGLLIGFILVVLALLVQTELDVRQIRKAYENQDKEDTAEGTPPERRR